MIMDVEFSCDCGLNIETVVYVPEPNFMAENSRDSSVERWSELLCDRCSKEHEIYVNNTFFGCECYVNNGDNEVRHGMPYFQDDEAEELDWLIKSKTQIDTFRMHIAIVESLLTTEVEPKAKYSLQVMLHGHVVAAIEGYLSSTFIHKVTNSESLIRKLVETDPTFANRTFTLKEIFEKQEALKMTVASHLKDLIFHDLKKVKPMYRDVLNFDFGDISWLFRAVSIRHHCVHRAGYDKEGNTLDISDESIRDLVSKSSELMEKVEFEISAIAECELQF